LVEVAVKEYGRLDIMINNAGIAPQQHGPVWEQDEGEWDKVMDVNGKGVFLCCKFAAAQMIKQEPGPSGDRGWIVNMCSILGLGGQAGVCRFCFFGESKKCGKLLTASCSELRCFQTRCRWHHQGCCFGLRSVQSPLQCRISWM
jgi:NAD(P)-dependent dehydrogenase (short-subunit alcohol dehydrogenase family)